MALLERVCSTLESACLSLRQHIPGPASSTHPLKSCEATPTNLNYSYNSALILLIYTTPTNLAHTGARLLHTSLEVVDMRTPLNHQPIVGVAGGETDDGLPRVREVKHDNERAEDHVSEQNTLKSVGPRLSV